MLIQPGKVRSRMDGEYRKSWPVKLCGLAAAKLRQTTTVTIDGDEAKELR